MSARTHSVCFTGRLLLKPGAGCSPFVSLRRAKRAASPLAAAAVGGRFSSLIHACSLHGRYV
jgi:hypothetical protein